MADKRLFLGNNVVLITDEEQVYDYDGVDVTTMRTEGSVLIEEDLEVRGTITGTISTAANLTITGTLTAQDVVTTDDVTVGDDLIVGGLATIAETLDVIGDTSVVVLDASGAVACGTTLNVTGLSTLATLLSGAATFTSTVSIAGAMTFDNAVTVNDDLDSDGDFVVKGNTIAPVPSKSSAPVSP